MPHHNSMRLAAIFAVATGITLSAAAQNLIYTADPPRVQVTASGVSPLRLPKCQTSDPTSPTPGILYCYTPGYIWTAYNVLPLFKAGNFGQGQSRSMSSGRTPSLRSPGSDRRSRPIPMEHPSIRRPKLDRAHPLRVLPTVFPPAMEPRLCGMRPGLRQQAAAQ